jgi:rhamnosyltransferase
MFEDLIFAAKAIMAGYKIAYVPEATVWHSHNFALPQLFRRYQDAGLSLRNYPWILEHGKTDREGLAFLRAEIRYLAQNGLHRWIPLAFTESFFKFVGFWFGVHGTGANRVPKTTIVPKRKYA